MSSSWMASATELSRLLGLGCKRSRAEEKTLRRRLSVFGLTVFFVLSSFVDLVRVCLGFLFVFVLAVVLMVVVIVCLMILMLFSGF